MQTFWKRLTQFQGLTNAMDDEPFNPLPSFLTSQKKTPRLLLQQSSPSIFTDPFLAFFIGGFVLAISFSCFGSLSLPGLTQEPGQLPSDVSRLGEIEVAPVRLNGIVLFTVASPTVRDRTQTNTTTPVEIRAINIQQNLERSIKTELNWGLPQSLIHTNLLGRGGAPVVAPPIKPEEVVVTLVQEGEEVVIQVNNGQRITPIKILSVTQWDGDYHGIPVKLLAQQWQGFIQYHLRQIVAERLPRAFYQQLSHAGLIVLGFTSVSSLGWLVKRSLVLQVKKLLIQQQEQLKTLENSPVPSIDHSQVSSLLSPSPRYSTVGGNQDVDKHHFLTSQGEKILRGWRHISGLERQLSTYALVQWLLNWSIAVIGIGCFHWILIIFPFSRGYATIILGIPILLLVIWFITGFASRVGSVMIDQLTTVWDENTLFAFGNNPRKSLRFTTTVRAIKGLKSFAVYTVGLTTVLAVIGVPVGSLLAGSAVLAFTLSFGIQNLVKDLVNGCLILWEDQYAIGDFVTIGRAAGFVENMNLRVTQLRSSDGRLITIPNSSIIQVENSTRTWSRVDLRIEVDYETDVTSAMEVLQKVTSGLLIDKDWGDRLIEPAEVLGIEKLSYTGMELRIMMKTQPGHQWAVARELRFRVKKALSDQNIYLAAPTSCSP